jgi:short-subunit dehydrogenase
MAENHPQNGSSHNGSAQNGFYRATRVLVTGASGELGGALALAYARSGAALSLWGRDHARLERIASQCLSAGARDAQIRQIDLMNVDAAVAAAAQDDDDAPFDIAIFASGLGDIRTSGALVESAALIARLGVVNFVGPAAIATELASRMALRGHGTIVLIGSAASFHALPFAAAYASSKAGLARFAQALRINVAPHGVRVTLVSPGFIDTAAARQVPGPKPLAIPVATAAVRIVRAAAAGKAHLVTPWPFALLRVIDRALPRRLRDQLLRSLTPPGR